MTPLPVLAKMSVVISTYWIIHGVQLSILTDAICGVTSCLALCCAVSRSVCLPTTRGSIGQKQTKTIGGVLLRRGPATFRLKKKTALFTSDNECPYKPSSNRGILVSTKYKPTVNYGFEDLSFTWWLSPSWFFMDPEETIFGREDGCDWESEDMLCSVIC